MRALRGREWALSLLTMIGVGLSLSVAPRPAAADVAPAVIGVTVTQSVARPGEEVIYVVEMSANLDGDYIIDATVTLPAAATITSAEPYQCAQGSAQVSGSTATFDAEVTGNPDNPQSCGMLLTVVFSAPGFYAAAQTSISGTYSTTGSSGALDVIYNQTDITIAGDPLKPAAPAVCELTPDMAVSPELINLAPGGTAVIELAMRNLCKDAPTPSGDVVLSLSDGINVVEHSAGMTNLGNRAAVQNFTLSPDETRRWTVTVTAADQLVAAPQHITEYYTGGRVLSRIDGVFITPVPAVEAAPAPVVEAAAAAPAPAPIPAALPNTAGEQAALPFSTLLLAIGAAVAAFTISRRTITR